MKSHIYTVIVTVCVLVTGFFAWQYWSLLRAVVNLNQTVANHDSAINKIVDLINRSTPPAQK